MCSNEFRIFSHGKHGTFGHILFLPLGICVHTFDLLRSQTKGMTPNCVYKCPQTGIETVIISAFT